MSESATTPLLGGRNSSSSGGGEDDVGRSGPTLSVIARMLGALSAGRLPSNDQLYALLHRGAGFLDGLGDAVPRNVDAERYTDRAADSEEEGMVGDDTSMHLATMLKETAALARQFARWIHGQAAEGDSTSAPAGNANEQIQRFVWHFGRLLGSRPVDVDVDADVQGGLKDAAEAAKDAAKQAKEDAVGGTRALVQIVSLVIGSDELRRLPSDVVRYLRTSLAEGAEQVETRAADVKEALKGPTGEGGGEVKDEQEKDFAAPADAIVEARQGAENAAGAALQLGQAEAKSKSKEDRAFKWRDEVVGRIARLIEALQSDPGYANAVSTLLDISQRYAEVIDEATEEVKSAVEQTRPQETANGESDTMEHAKSLGEHGLDEAQGAVEATLSSTKVDGHVSVRASHHVVEAGRAAREVVEGLAGGKSMGPILDAARTLRDTAYEDGALRQWLDDVGSFAQRTVAAAVDAHNQDADGQDDAKKAANSSSSLQIKSEEAQKELHSLVARFEDLVSTRPALLQAMDELKRQTADMIDAVLSDVAIGRLRARFARVSSLARQTFAEGVRDAYQTGSHLTSLLLKALLPSLGDILGSVPMPRVEFASDSVDAVVEDVVVPLVQLVPDTVRVQTSQDWLWQRNTSSTTAINNVDTTWKVHVGGLQLALSDISFFVEEKATAPDPDSCGGCCGCYVRRDTEAASSTSCLCQGPASWFAYREKAILDVGAYEPGLGLEIDLEDAGQQSSSSARKRKTKKTKGEEDEEELDDMVSDRRRRFFNVRDVTLTSSHSIHYKLRNSRHWLINAIVVAASRPLVRLVLRRIVCAQVTHAFEQLDEKVYDYHFRAKRLVSKAAARREGGADMPSWSEYMRVLMDAEAGKSRARVRKERKEREEEEKQQEREKEEEQEEIQEQQPGPSKTMEIKPTSIIKHDPNGSYSLAVGVKPGRGVLSADKRGPQTRHTALRDDIMYGQWKKLADRPVKGAQRAWNDTRDQAGLTNVDVQTSVDGINSNIAAVGQAKREAQQTRDQLRHEQQDDEQQDDETWKSAAFDL